MAAFASSTASGLATIFYSLYLNPVTSQATLSSPARIRSSPRVFRGIQSLRRHGFRRFSHNVTADRFNSFSCNCLSAVSTSTIDYEVNFGIYVSVSLESRFEWCQNQSD